MEGLQIPLNHVLILAALLFACGLVGIMIRRNVIFILMALEVMLNAAALAGHGSSEEVARMREINKC